MVTVHEEGRAPVILSLKTALSRITDDIDMEEYGRLTSALFNGELITVVLKDGNGRPATMHLTEFANPQIELFNETQEVSAAGLPLFRYTADCTVLLELPVEVTCLAPDEPSATVLVEETMNGMREPNADFTISISHQDIAHLHRRIDAAKKPRDLSVTHTTVHSITEQKRLEATS